VSEDIGSTSKTTFNTETVSATIITDTNEAIVAHRMPRSPTFSSVLFSTILVRIHGFKSRTVQSIVGLSLTVPLHIKQFGDEAMTTTGPLPCNS